MEYFEAICIGGCFTSPMPFSAMSTLNPNNFHSTLEAHMKFNRTVFTGLMLLFGTLALILPTKSNAQAFGTPFQTTVQININNFVYTPITIPHGKRLVIQNLNLSGEASADPYVQPIVLLNSTINGGASINYYFAPSVSTVDPTQYYANYPLTIYADTLQVSPAFAGYTPFSLAFNVVITGYLVPINNF
jgi:hypothetical protein